MRHAFGGGALDFFFFFRSFFFFYLAGLCETLFGGGALEW